MEYLRILKCCQMVEDFKNEAAINQCNDSIDIKQVAVYESRTACRDFSREAAMGLEETMVAMQLL